MSGISETEHLRHKLMRADAGFTFDQPTQVECEAILREHDKLLAALREIIDLDHHNHGPESRATKIARTAIQQSARIARCDKCGTDYTPGERQSFCPHERR